MIEFVLTFFVLLLVVAGMSIGVLHGREPISGSCEGLVNLGVDGRVRFAAVRTVVSRRLMVAGAIASSMPPSRNLL